MDRSNRLKSGYSAGPDLFSHGQLSERSGPEAVKTSGDGSQQSSMGVLAKDHPLTVPEGKGGVEGASLVIVKSLAVVLEKVSRIIDSLLEKNVFVTIFQEGKNPSFSDEGEKRRNGNIFKHLD